MRLEGKVALVTGGGSGIGQASCELFAREGARVAVADWRREAADDVAAAIGAAGGKAIATSGDVAAPADVERMVEQTLARFGRIDVLLSNAGQELVASVLETDEGQWDRVLGTNLKGCFLSSKAVLPHMIRQGGGSIILTASQLAFVGAKNFAAYSASKGGVLNLARAMALDHAEQNIRVNALCPGAVETPLLLRQFEERAGPQGTLADLAALHALNRLAKPSEIAAAALFLASDESSFVTGSALVVDGGYLAR